MVKYLKAKLLVLLCIAAVSFSYGQSGTITGVITDRTSGETLPGANVVIDGTTTGTTADMNGRYRLEVPAGQVKLVASFIGFDPQPATITVNAGQTVTLNFALYADITQLEEFVVIGYGVQKKTDRTGAVVNVRADEMNRGVLTDPIQGLQGKAAGVTITKKGGDPNAGFDVRIRGASALATSTAPLYVVDGVPGVDPTTIASEDIESFNVLKDASSAAIYGSRGANGVIIITTKRGKDKKGSNIGFSSVVSTDYVANRLNLLSASQLRDFVQQNGLEDKFIDGGGDVDWQDEVYRPGTSQTHTLTFSGSSEKSSHYASVSYSNFEGVIIGTAKQRTNALINFDQKALNDKLTIQSGLSGTFEKNDYISYSGNGPNDVLYHMIQRNPTDPVRNADGTFYDVQREFNYWNPVALVEQIQNERDAKKFYGFVKADLDIYKGFSAGVNLAYTRDDSEHFYFEPSYLRLATTAGFGGRSYNNKDSRLLETTLRYLTEINNLNMNFVGGYSFQEEFFTGFRAQGQKPFLDYAMSNNLALLQNINPGDISSYKSSNRLISFFGRGVFSYDSKYILTGTIRRDGSSKFGRNNEWGWFPSASFKWQISNESFMESVDFINNLGLRVGFGITGNQEIGSYRDIEYYVNAGNSINFETGEESILFEFAHAANPDLKWEENREINVGVDYGFLNDKISGSLDFFVKNTYDLLGEYSVPVPPYPVGRIWANVGEIQVKGIDFNVQYYPIRNRNFEWRTSMIFSAYKQEVVSLSNDKFEWTRLQEGYLDGRGLVGDINWTQIIAPGYSIGTWYMPEYAGIVPQNFPDESLRGQWLFYTAAGGITTDPQLAERRVMGKALPDFEIGWSNYFNFYKDFDMSMTFRALYGYQIFNTTKLIFGNPNWLPNLNVTEDALAEFERGLKDNPKLSSYYLEDASFLRLDNISIGYNIRKKFGVDNIRVSLSSNNVFTLTNYTGIDPEISTSGRSFGLDQYNVYPKTRTITLGLNVSL